MFFKVFLFLNKQFFKVFKAPVTNSRFFKVSKVFPGASPQTAKLIDSLTSLIFLWLLPSLLETTANNFQILISLPDIFKHSNVCPNVAENKTN